MRALVATFVFLSAMLPATSHGGPSSTTAKAAKELAEHLIGKGGKEATELAVETLAKKIETLALKYGDDALIAVKKVGPKTFRLVDDAGANGVRTVKLLARYGDNAVWIVKKKNRMAIFVKYGDDAAEAMMEHGEIAEPLISSFQTPAATALKAISPQNGRRLAILAEDGSLAKIGKTDDLLGVVARHGDPAMDFIWRNKGALAVAGTLAAFLANPQPFIDGTVDVSKAVTENVGKADRK
ncbi:MAG TPA: hypothetical protein VHZ24_08225 [Pirellulales bacterium]|nr:hypothetical protein [Pirellulales bacterium]